MSWIISLFGLALLTLASGLETREVGFLLRVEDALRAKTARRRTLLHELSMCTTQAIQWVFGERLFSLRAAWTSAGISLASFLLWLLVLLGSGSPTEASRDGFPEGLSGVIWGLPMSIAVVTTVGLLPRIHRHAAKFLWFIFIMWLLNVSPVFVELQAYSQAVVVALGLAWLCGSAGNLVAAWVLRWRLGMTASQSLRTQGTPIVVTFLVAIGVALAPMAVAIIGVAVTPLGTWMHRSVPHFAAMPLALICVIGAANAVTTCLAVACVVALAFAVFRLGAVAMVRWSLSPPVSQRLFRMQRPIFWAGLLLLLGPVVAGIVMK